MQETEHKDFLGNVLGIGDKVVFMRKGYRSLMVGNIKTMAEQSCLIEHDTPYNTKDETRQFYDQIILYREPHA